MSNPEKRFAIFRHNDKKFHSYSEITTAEKHNTREIDVPNADPQKSWERIYGGDKAADTLKTLLQKHNIKPRKNAALAMEYLMTYSPEMAGKIPRDEWMKANIEFLKAEHGEGLLSVDFHEDETTPHLQAICAPLIEKTVRGKKQMRLSGVDFWKGKDKLSARQDRYADAMAQFGLERGLKGSTASHTTIKEFYKILNAANKDHSKTYQETIQKYKELETIERPGIFGIKEAWNNLTGELRQTLTRLGNALKIISRLDADKKLLQSNLERSEATVAQLRKRLSSSNVQDLEKQIEDLKLDAEILETDLTSAEYKNVDLTRDNNELTEVVNNQAELIQSQSDKIRLLSREVNRNRSYEDQTLNI